MLCVGPSGKGSCLQLWYHMYGRGVGKLRVYQQTVYGKETLIFSQSGDQGRLWRFGQATLLPQDEPYRVSKMNKVNISSVSLVTLQKESAAYVNKTVKLVDTQVMPFVVCKDKGLFFCCE